MECVSAHGPHVASYHRKKSRTHGLQVVYSVDMHNLSVVYCVQDYIVLVVMVVVCVPVLCVCVCSLHVSYGVISFECDLQCLLCDLCMIPMWS